MPTARVDVVNVAWPPASSGTDASVVVPSMNVAMPVGTVDPMTVAVKVTPAPSVDGLLFDRTYVVVVRSLTVSVTGAVRLWLPLVPLIVNVKVPVGVVGLVVTVIVEDPDVVTDVGLNVAAAPVGSPVTLKVTVPLNPLDGATSTE